MEAILEDFEQQKVSHAVCLGDVVGYNASPSECLELVRSLSCPVIKGNHDEEASEDRDISHFNELAYVSMQYSRERLSEEQKGFLRSLPLQRSVSDFTVVHATLDGPAQWTYAFNISDAETSFVYQRTTVCFHGHTHVPRVFVKDTKVHEFFYKRIEVKEGKLYFVNVGSVGQPRDGDWRAAYVIYDTDQQTIELRRVPYDIAKSQQKIISAGLPERLAERLANAV